MILQKKLDFFIKYVIMFVTFSSINFNEYIHLKIDKKNFIEIDNEFKVNLYENDTSFTKYNTKLKPIAFYYPEYNNISYNKFVFEDEIQTQHNNIKLKKLIMKQTKLAENHGIYGFAIYFDLFKLNFYHEITNIFFSEVNFPFFLIWKNADIDNINIKLIENLISNFKKYMISSNYIKIKQKPIFSISKPYKFSNIKYTMTNIRKVAEEKGIGKLFIIYPFTGNIKGKNFSSEFDATYDFSKVDLIEHTIIKPNILYYSGFIYQNLILNKFNFNFPFFRSCVIDYKSFKDYNPEKFYIANNLIFEWENLNYNKSEGIVFINSWNNYKEGKYLEPDELYGYASINSFSKSIFNLPFQQNNLSCNIQQNFFIAIHVHVFYEDLFMEIMDKLSLMPFKYDLFISTISKEKKLFIEKCLLSLNSNNYEIRIFKNIGRDIFPFVTQMKAKFKKYKYICHIHTKKSNHKSLLGANWRNYMYSNLFGNKNLISEIISDFEKNEKLGFIFPEIYYDLIKDVYGFDNIDFSLNKPNKLYMNLILKKIDKKYKIGEKIDFPAGNMFWAKIKAIHQIFNIRIKFPKELNQTNETIMHGIERIWLYLVKLNGYYYKAILKHY